MSVQLDFDEVYEGFQLKILHYVARMTGIDETEDITQEVFQKISLSLEDFKGKSNLSTWIYRIATNTALDKFRSKAFKHSSARSSLEDSIEDRNVWVPAVYYCFS